MMTIFWREMKANRRALIIWSVCIFLLIASGMGKYTAYTSGGASADVFKEMPHTIKALLGMGDFDMTTMSGYYAMLFLYIELTVAIHAALLGSGIIAKEERDKTTEFLMVKPVSRGTVITAKYGAALVNVLIVNAVTWITSAVMVASYNKGPDVSGEIAMFLLSMLIVQLIFLSLGALAAAAMKNPKSAGTVSTAILLGSFIVSKITDLAEGLKVLNVLSPFTYFSYSRIVDGAALNGGIVLLSLLLAAGFAVLTYRFYRRRDLNV